jgi:protein TonB
MQYTQLKFKGFTSLFLAAGLLAACNSNQSSDKIADTAATATYSSPDTVQTTVHDTVTVEKSVPVPAQSSAAQSAPPSQPSAAPAQPSASPSTPVATTPKPAPKRKGRVVVVVVPSPRHANPKPDRTGVYEYSEVSPMYQGGQAAVERYINNHIQYPQAALDNGREGRVGVSFIVNETGRVTDAHVVGKGLGQGLDAEAVRVVSSMPNWRPGTVKGRPVKTRVTLPIIFKIEE